MAGFEATWKIRAQSFSHMAGNKVFHRNRGRADLRLARPDLPRMSSQDMRLDMSHPVDVRLEHVQSIDIGCPCRHCHAASSLHSVSLLPTCDVVQLLLVHMHIDWRSS
mmetsp:Transcript_10326/g.31088  ORF Transcript_10326/g.31088 Transcript_10326/m.31088 type:complete len:108 (+) Transcript_10326:941-1264(+)